MRFGQLVNTVTQARDKMVIDTFSDLVVHLPAKGYGTTEFDMSDERRDALVNAGRAATEAYLTAPDGVLAAPKDLDLEELMHAQKRRIVLLLAFWANRYYYEKTCSNMFDFLAAEFILYKFVLIQWREHYSDLMVWT